MKKYLLVVSVALLAAAGCSKQTDVTKNLAPTPTVEAITPTPIITATPTPSGSPSFNNQTGIYDSPFFKITITPGWTAKEAVKTTNLGTNPNPAAVNIIKGNYILYINAYAEQASGIQGGRMVEIAGGAPSVDAVITDQPNVCGTSQTETGYPGHPRIDMYVGPSNKTDYCNVPANGKTAWYFSYITDKNGGYFNYYNFQPGNGIVGYVITMAYNSKDVNKLPVKGSTELTTMLNQMTSMLQTLLIKQQ